MRTDRRGHGERTVGLRATLVLLLIFLLCWYLLSHLRLCSLPLPAPPPQALCPTLLPDSAPRNAEASVPMKLLVSKHPLLSPLSPGVRDGPGPRSRPRVTPAPGLTHAHLLRSPRPELPACAVSSRRLPNGAPVRVETVFSPCTGAAAVFLDCFKGVKALALNIYLVHGLPFSLPFLCLPLQFSVYCVILGVIHWHQVLGRYRVARYIVIKGAYEAPVWAW